MASRPATVTDLIDSLELGLPGEELSITAALVAFYELDADANIGQQLADRNVDEVLGIVLTAVEPFAALILDVFDFVGRLEANVQGHLEIELAANLAEALRLDVERFRRYERDVVRGASRRVDLDILLSMSDGSWGSWHDWFWPFNCILQVGGPPLAQFCDGCPRPELIAQFSWVRSVFESLSAQARVRLAERGGEAPSTNADYMVDRLAKVWPSEVALRGHFSNSKCLMSSSTWMQNLWPRVLTEFHAAEVRGDYDDVRRLLALPYWKHRWQLYEVWVLAQLLDAIGLHRVELVTENGVWALPVGGSAKTAIALVPSIGATVWYQHQREPAAALFAGQEHRPEVIVEASDGTVLLVVEAKARRGLARADVEAFLFPLLQWRPRAALLANYFSVKDAPPLVETVQADSALAASSEYQPIGVGASPVQSWLRRQCDTLIPRPTRVIVVDVSSSMASEEAQRVTRSLADDAYRSVFVAFADQAQVNRDGPEFDARNLGVGTNLAGARDVLLRDLKNELTGPSAEVHLVSDLEFEEGQFDAFAIEVQRCGAKLLVHSWESSAVESARRSFRYLATDQLHIHTKQS